jgi:hypothetical protein
MATAVRSGSFSRVTVDYGDIRVLEIRTEGALRFHASVHKVVRRTVKHDSAARQHAHAAAQMSDVLGQMSRQQDHSITPDVGDDLAHTDSLLRVEPNRWLVQNQEFRSMDDRCCNPKTLTLSPRKGPAPLTHSIRQLDGCEGVGRVLGAFRSRYALYPRRVRNGVLQPHLTGERKSLRQVPHSTSIVSADADCSALGARHAHEQPQ